MLGKSSDSEEGFDRVSLWRAGTIGVKVDSQRFSLWPSLGANPLLGANGTEAMQVLLAKGEHGLTDYLKVGPFMGAEAVLALKPDHPLLLHLDDTLSQYDLGEAEIRRVQGWVELTGTPWTSEHIGFSAADVDLDDALVYQADSNMLSRAQALENIVHSACKLADALPVPLLLENIPLFPNLAHMHVCHPDFIAEVIAQSDCDLLLDLAHARVTADVLGCDVHDYLLRLPLKRVVELHISGPRPLYELDDHMRCLVRRNAPSVAHLISFDEDNLVDVHDTMRERDYALLEWTLEHTRPKAISLEYFRDPHDLREQLVRLGELLDR